MISLLDISRHISDQRAFGPVAKQLGFDSDGDIRRFILKSYGKAIRQVPDASRPKAAMFFLEPPSTPQAIAAPAAIVPVIHRIQADVATKLYAVPLDFAGGVLDEDTLSTQAQRQMTGNMWSPGVAQLLSGSAHRCVVWADGVEAKIYLNGDTFAEYVDVVEELGGGTSRNLSRLSWADGEIAYEFATHEMNDTGPTGMWRLPNRHILKPKPEVVMSKSFGRYLQLRMAGYRHHDIESSVANSGRADIILHTVLSQVYIVEIKWVGRSLPGTKEDESTKRILAELKKKKSKWFTVYDDAVFESGAKQVAIYYGSGAYNKAYLVVFDCCPEAPQRGHCDVAVDPAHVDPHDVRHFRLLRACVDPRKASKASKGTS